eukprot:7601081-Alexandrium_andersonii.AAC.1
MLERQAGQKLGWEEGARPFIEDARRTIKPGFKGLDDLQKACLKTMLCGAVWTRCRVQQSQVENVDQRCPMCRAHVDTVPRRLWMCYATKADREQLFSADEINEAQEACNRL